jgi:hypothetical protein
MGGNELFGVQNQHPEEAQAIGATKAIFSVLTKEIKNSTFCHIKQPTGPMLF